MRQLSWLISKAGILALRRFYGLYVGATDTGSAIGILKPCSRSAALRWISATLSLGTALYAREIEKRLRWYWKKASRWRSWRAYIKVKGRWTYLYRAIDKYGETIDFYLSSPRDAKAAMGFLGKALNGLKDWQKPLSINTDKGPTYGIALAALKKEGRLPEEARYRQVNYLNNVLEFDHGKLRQLINPVRGLKSLKAAYATIKSFEMMRALKKARQSFGNAAMGLWEKCA